mmetsp:Transcript_15013/g.23070  ORF Transcript_15013/g.23070 Transcript_15013/m.23070 type:complete len:390 (-) Transcript_15013:237-1406(-)
MDELLTVIIQTSPIPSHPSTALLEALFRSFKNADGLLEANIVVLADGCDTTHDEEENVKRGKASMRTSENYALFLSKLRGMVERCEPPFVASKEGKGRIRLVELPKQHGSARAIQAAFWEYDLVRTPFVMICQHDNFFIHPTSLKSIVNALHKRPGLGIGVKCIHFLSTSTMNYPQKVKRRYGLDLPPVHLPDLLDAPLNPLAFWYGRTHISTSAYYRKFAVWENRHFSKGDHLEELLGPAQLKDICERGPIAHKEYGTYVLDQGVEVMYHLSGRRALAVPTQQALTPLHHEQILSMQEIKETNEFREKKSANIDDAPLHVGDSFTTARSCRAIVPGLQFASPPPEQKKLRGRFKQKCFGCGIKGHSYKWCPMLLQSQQRTTTDVIDLS